MKPKKWTYGTIGTVSQGTMRTEDLIPAFTAELRWLGHRSQLLTRIERRKGEKYYESDLAQRDLDCLFDMLESHALPYMYFGSHPGDGANYGFWVREDIEHDFDGLKVEDLADVPVDYNGEILLINDHGNMTLYIKTPHKFKEIWSVV